MQVSEAMAKYLVLRTTLYSKMLKYNYVQANLKILFPFNTAHWLNNIIFNVKLLIVYKLLLYCMKLTG